MGCTTDGGLMGTVGGGAGFMGMYVATG